MSYRLVFTKQAQKDWVNILASPLKGKAAKLLDIIQGNPYTQPYEKLVGDLSGLYSKRINIQHRLIYRVEEEIKTVVVIRMWTHYGDN